MGTLSGAKREQKPCLEGDTASEGKVKKVLRNIRVSGPRGRGPSAWVPHKHRLRRDTGGGP
jgi:hypothetical protein